MPDQPGDEGDEALMAVLLGESVPEADERARERYESAAHDMEIIREQLCLLGARLSWDPGVRPVRAPAPPPAPSPGPGPGRGRGPGAVRRPGRLRRAALALAGSALILAALAGIGAQRAAGPATSAKLTPEGLVACALVIADGRVAEVEEAGAWTRVVLSVDRYLKPARGPAETVFYVRSAEAGRYPEGERMVVRVSRFLDEGVDASLGADIGPAWRWMSRALPGSRGLGCDVRG
ncbi:hypothetical protein [Streptomyces sp. CAU 1734]|uniref:hypothetical protein n=1 Tax=Streptomyces sp. CAU 1734 TaxID=3140360 RepID=UPI0032609C1C